MRRRFSFAVAALALAAPIAGIASMHGCASNDFESVCLWVADPNNCFRKFRQDAEDNGQTCKPQGNPSPVNLADTTNPNGNANGYFLSREALDVCYIGGGGTVVFDPPIDLTMIPPDPLADPVTYKMTFTLPDGTECGSATYRSAHGFSFTINGPPDAGGTTGSSSSSSGASDAGPSIPYGSYTQVIQPGSDEFQATCPSGESHKFNLFEAEGASFPADGGSQTSCPLYADLVPRAALAINPGGIGASGAISFTIYWPPLDNSGYGQGDAGAIEQQGTAIAAEPVTYFNCTIGPQDKLCADGVKNGAETDIDCGGAESEPGCPARCGDGQGCVRDCDCVDSMYCGVVAGVKVCVAPEGGAPPARDCSAFVICKDGVQNGAETDIDCGGGQCSACSDGKKCVENTDCVSNNCFNKVCVTPACTNGVQDTGETAIDCGGPCVNEGKTCDNGKACATNDDCTSGNCVNNLCDLPKCTDGVQNGNETDVDCGGACPKCDNLKTCKVNEDCINSACVPLNGKTVCLFPSCSDMVKDGDETDKDCGGSKCGPCADGATCTKNSECTSNLCGAATTSTKKCFPTSCITDAGTTCGGGMCPLCDVTDPCTKNADCLSNACTINDPDAGTGTCVTSSCNDNLLNGAETDVDCGGGSCPVCDPGKTCLSNSDCGGTLKQCINKVCQ